MKSATKLAIGACAVAYVLTAACWSSGFLNLVPRPIGFVFGNLGMAQSWAMFAHVAPNRNDYERIYADVRLSDGRTVRWSFPSTRWNTPLGEARAERFADAAYFLTGGFSGDPLGKYWSRQLARYAARAGAGSARPLSVDLVYPGSEPVYLLKDFREL